MTLEQFQELIELVIYPGTSPHLLVTGWQVNQTMGSSCQQQMMMCLGVKSGSTAVSGQLIEYLTWKYIVPLTGVTDLVSACIVLEFQQHCMLVKTILALLLQIKELRK